jgi:hypothetical protein
LKSGEMAADAILDGLRTGDLGGAALGRFRPVLERGIGSVRRLVHAFYSQDFNFGAFLRRYPEHKRDVVDILIGQVFDRDFDDLFEHMGEMFDLPDLSPPQALPAS